MANNAIFARLSNLWTGFISLWVSDVEKAHPEIAYQNAIASMIEKYGQLKAATGSIIARRQEITARLETHERELAAVSADLETALATNQDDLAVVLIQKKNALDTAITDLRAEATQATVYSLIICQVALVAQALSSARAWARPTCPAPSRACARPNRCSPPPRWCC